VAFGDNGDVKRRIDSKELLIFQVFVRKGVQWLENVLFAADLHDGDDGASVCVYVVSPNSESVAHGARVNLIFAERLAHVKTIN
jgi:hypothetical protein